MQLSLRASQLCNLLSENQLVFRDLKNITQNMKTYLDNKSCLYYQDCENININIDNKINKLILIGCKNIEITICGLINGIDIDKSYCINIKSKKENLNSINIEKSTQINIVFSRKFYKTIKCDINQCKCVKILDLKNKLMNFDNFGHASIFIN